MSACAVENGAKQPQQKPASIGSPNVYDGFYVALTDSIKIDLYASWLNYFPDDPHPWYSESSNHSFSFDPLLLWFHAETPITGVGGSFEMVAWRRVREYYQSGTAVTEALTQDLPLLKFSVTNVSNHTYHFEKLSPYCDCSDAYHWSITGTIAVREASLQVNLWEESGGGVLVSYSGIHYAAELTLTPSSQLPIPECISGKTCIFRYGNISYSFTNTNEGSFPWVMYGY